MNITNSPLYIYLLPIVLFIVIIGINRYFYNNKNNLQIIRKEWSDKSFLPIKESVDSIDMYWLENQMNDTYKGIDATTWNDLNMNEVFTEINYTKSSVGSEYLFNQLHNPQPDESNLLIEETTYTLLNNDTGVREELLLNLMKLGKEDYSNSSSFFTAQITNIQHIYLYVLASSLPIISILLMIFWQIHIGFYSLIISIVINYFIYYKNRLKLEKSLNATAYVSRIIHTAKSIGKIDIPEFQPLAIQLRDKIEPLKKILFFEKIVSFGKSSNSMDALFEYIRIVFLLDFISYYNMIHLITKYNEHYRSIWNSIGQLDAAVAIVFYRRKLHNFTLPTFIEKEEIHFTHMYHPLITKPIKNSTSLKKGTLLTGSNASGKSTYIKAIAINCILAQTIHTALADSWKMKIGNIITSIAIKDDVIEGESYFKAEIKSLKRIIEATQTGDFTISIIDEILKGTNTIERVSSSAAIMNWLHKQPGLTIIASHDIELTEIGEGLYTNYHFKESIVNGNIEFDYKIKAGPTTTKNAIKLLEVYDYPAEIIASANRFSKDYSKEQVWQKLLNIL